jgi:hypothetical protein
MIATSRAEGGDNSVPWYAGVRAYSRADSGRKSLICLNALTALLVGTRLLGFDLDEASGLLQDFQGLAILGGAYWGVYCGCRAFKGVAIAISGLATAFLFIVLMTTRLWTTDTLLTLTTDLTLAVYGGMLLWSQPVNSFLKCQREQLSR